VRNCDHCPFQEPGPKDVASSNRRYRVCGVLCVCSIYAFLAQQIGAAFFPPSEGDMQLIESFGVFAGAFVARPLGGMLFGYLGDWLGKKQSVSRTSSSSSSSSS
jgi:MFS family permease